MADYATLLRDHITLTCRSIDRIFLQAYVPKLLSVGQVCRFLHRQRGFPIPSSAVFGQIGEAYVAEIQRWAKANDIPIHYFAKKENKEKFAEPLLRAAAEQGGDGKVVLIGIAQEKASTWRSWKKKGQEKASILTWSGAARWRSLTELVPGRRTQYPRRSSPAARRRSTARRRLSQPASV